MQIDLRRNCSMWLSSELLEESSDQSHPCLKNFNRLFDGNDYFIPSSTSESPFWIRLIAQIINTIVCVTGLMGNSVVIYVITLLKKGEITFYIYLINLAIADIVFLVGIPMEVVTVLIGYWPFNTYLCKAYFYTTMVNSITFAPLLLGLSCDSYLSSRSSEKVNKLRIPNIAKRIAIIIWVMSTLMIMPVVEFTNAVEVENRGQCNVIWPDTEFTPGHMFFQVFSFIGGYALYVPFMVFVSLCKIRQVCKQTAPILWARNIEVETAENENIISNGLLKDETKLVIGLVTAFIICRTPLWVLQIYLDSMSSIGNDYEIMILLIFGRCLCYANTVINPILCIFLSVDFSRCAGYIMCCRRDQGRIVLPNIESSEIRIGSLGQNETGHDECPAVASVEL